jgi:TPR repeat protein
MLLATMSSAGTAQDYEKGYRAYLIGRYEIALKEWKPLAEQGDIQAQVSLGILYEFGEGNAQSYLDAVYWYLLAADQGNAIAQYKLGAMYDNGHGVSQDYAEAVHWYRLAADQGDASAQSSIGSMYATGNGVPQDFAEAARWVQLAAAQGHAIAQNNLGVSYAHGTGVPQDDAAAHMWLNIASANGSEKSKEFRDIVEARMTSAEISEAQGRARVCMASNYQDCDLAEPHMNGSSAANLIVQW